MEENEICRSDVVHLYDVLLLCMYLLACCERDLKRFEAKVKTLTLLL